MAINCLHKCLITCWCYVRKVYCFVGTMDFGMWEVLCYSSSIIPLGVSIKKGLFISRFWTRPKGLIERNKHSLSIFFSQSGLEIWEKWVWDSLENSAFTALNQRCPTLSSIATCGENHYFFNFIFYDVLKISVVNFFNFY